MSEKELKKIFAILFEMKKRVKKIEEIINNNGSRKCRPNRSERSEEPLHGESPSG